MSGTAVLAVLLAWVVIGVSGNPTPEQIRDACRDHGRTVNYVPGGWFTWSGSQKVICSDGAVLKVEQ